MTEHEEHIARRVADGWYAVHTCQECKREFNSPGEAVVTKPLSSEQTAKLVYDTCCEYFGQGHEEHSIPIIAQAIREARAEVLAACIKAVNAKLCPILNSIGPGLVYVADEVEEAIRTVQPAAKDLEALLWEEREKALLNIIAWRRDLLEAWRTDSRAWMTALLEGGPNMDIEKARAIEEKP